MIRVNCLTGDEICLILYTLSLETPDKKITVERLKAYKAKFVAEKLNVVKCKLTEDGVKLVDSIFEKLAIKILDNQEK